MESENFELLENTDITTFLIDRPWVTYRTYADLEKLGARFGSPNPEGSNRLRRIFIATLNSYLVVIRGKLSQQITI